MGYYVSIDECNIFIAKSDLQKAYQACVDLNQKDNLKSGGGGDYKLPNGAKVTIKSRRPKGMTYHPCKWFSWMEADYPNKLKNLIEILESLGFEVQEDNDGNIVYLNYDNKIGDEVHFFKVIAPYVKNNSHISWVGEDHTMWRWLFKSKKMIVQQANIVWK